jgi:hypothetical protein
MRTSALVLVGLACVVGCSSSSNDPFGPTPDFGQVEARFNAPTGTFAAGSESGVLAGLTQQKAAQSGGFGIGGAGGASSTASGGTTAKSLRFLDANGGTSFCPALASGAEAGSCACPNGGTLAYDLSGMQQMKNYKGGPVDVTLKVRAETCAVGDASIDGTEFAKITSTATPSQTDLMMLFDLHLTATAKGQTERVDADFEYLNGKFWFSIGVNDGTVVVSADSAFDSTAKTGTLVVKDRNETWTCTFTGGKGTCTSDKGASRPVASL